MIGVICPSDFEYRVLKHSHFRKKDTSLIQSGMGKLRTSYACHLLLKKYPRLKWVLLIGFAGGLTPDLKVGDILEPYTVVEQDYFAEPFEKFPNRIRIRKNGIQKLLPQSINGLILTQDRFLKENPYKNGTAEGLRRAVACDMESYAAAYFCERAGIPYSIIKLISDSADENADHDFLKACRELSPKLNQTALTAIDKIRSLI